MIYFEIWCKGGKFGYSYLSVRKVPKARKCSGILLSNVEGWKNDLPLKMHTLRRVPCVLYGTK